MGIRSLRLLFAIIGNLSALHSVGLEIKIQPTGSSAIDACVSSAAVKWQQLLADEVEVKVGVNLVSIDVQEVAHAESEYTEVDFSAFILAIEKARNSPLDQVFFQRIASKKSYSKLINGTKEFATKEHGKDYVQRGLTKIEMTRANAKALKLLPKSKDSLDAVIQINRNLVERQFNQLKTEREKLIFQSLIFHELGHVLGFVSGVNVLDYFYGTKGPNLSHREFANFATPLDFMRCSSESVRAGADMDWTVSNTEKHFAVDARCGGEYRVNNAWSRGVYNADGFEAGHWRNGSGLGLMVPMSSSELKVSLLDLLGLDAIGWTLINH